VTGHVGLCCLLGRKAACALGLQSALARLHIRSFLCLDSPSGDLGSLAGESFRWCGHGAERGCYFAVTILRALAIYGRPGRCGVRSRGPFATLKGVLAPMRVCAWRVTTWLVIISAGALPGGRGPLGWLLIVVAALAVALRSGNVRSHLMMERWIGFAVPLGVGRYGFILFDEF